VQRLRRRAADGLTAQGLHEIVGWSFEGAEQVTRLRIAQRPVIELENPMSSDQSRLRTTLLGSLLDVGRRNRSRGQSALRLFETGAVYLPGDAGGGSNALPSEPYHVAALLSGPIRPPTWRDPEPRAADFFAAKGVLGGMLDTVHVPWTVEADPDAAPFLHPGRAARILIGASPAGWIGEIHPEVAADWDYDAAVAAFELDLDAAAEHVQFTAYQDLTSFPEVREDLAVIVADTVTAAQVLEVVRAAGGSLLAGADVFDVYRDEQLIGAGHVSLALRLHFRARDRTLTDEEVAARRRKIASALAAQLEGRVRDS
jgi:phenylalanyl-tRNA synthetase beta chain